MKRRLALAGLLIAANAAAEAPPKVDLAEILASPRAYEGKSVTTCGWATNGFEDSNLTVSDARSFEQMDEAGLGIDWCKGAEKLMKPASRCVSGTLFAAPPLYEDAGNGRVKITIDNSSAYRWRIRQACSR